MSSNVAVDPELNDSRPSQHRLWRSRWAAIGAAVAVSFGAGGLFIGYADTPATPSSFFAVTPVRILDTRTNLGLAGQFTSPTSRDLLVTGSIPTANGTQVVVPAGATAVALNVTVVGPTANGFVSVRPANAAGAPTTSSINVRAGVPIANAVTVQLPTTGGDSGKVEITYDALGIAGPTAHVLVDVVGFFKPDVETVTQTLSAAGFTSDNLVVNYTSGCARQETSPFTVDLGLQLPVGVTITGFAGNIIDTNGTAGTLHLIKLTNNLTFLGTGSTPGAGAPGLVRVEVSLVTPEVVDVGEYFLISYVGGDGTAFQQVCGAEINYTVPAGVPGA